MTKPILNQIIDGDLDEHLDAITNTIALRKRAVAYKEFRPGDQCRLVNISPKYLTGATCTIQRHNPQRIVVTINPEWFEANPTKGRKYQGEVTVKPNMLEKIG